MPDSPKSPRVPIAIAVIAALILALVFVQGGHREEAPGARTTPGVDSSAPADPWEQLARRKPDDPMALGDVEAPVVMVVFSEFQCPFCGKFARDTEPVLVKKYVEDGTLRIEWRDFPYLGSESTVAARGGRAAAAQDRFWEFERALYADQLPPNSGDLDEGYLAGIAKKIGLDLDRFREDLASPEFEQAVQRDFAEGQDIGVSGTPAFVINGDPVIGAQPTEVFERAIEQAAEKVES